MRHEVERLGIQEDRRQQDSYRKQRISLNTEAEAPQVEGKFAKGCVVGCACALMLWALLWELWTMLRGAL